MDFGVDNFQPMAHYFLEKLMPIAKEAKYYKRKYLVVHCACTYKHNVFHIIIKDVAT